MIFPKRSMVLALGGGGARGLAHIGVLRVLERAGIQPAGISGTSMGAVVGSLFALGMSSEEILERFRDFMESDDYRRSGLRKLREQEATSALSILGKRIRRRIMLNVSLTRRSVFNPERLVRVIHRIVPDADFRDLHIPFVAVATDISMGLRVELDSGSLRKAVLASSSIPGFFPPIELGGSFLLDGAITDTVPVETAFHRWGGRVVAVDVSQGLDPYREEENILETVHRASKITSDHLCRLQAKQARLVLIPEVSGIPWYDFDRIDDLVEAGEMCAAERLSEIRWGVLRRILRHIREGRGKTAMLF